MNDCSISITTLPPVVFDRLPSHRGILCSLFALHFLSWAVKSVLSCLTHIWRTFFLFPVQQDRTPTVFGCSYAHIFLFLAKQRFINFDNNLKSIHLCTHLRIVRRIYDHFSQHVEIMHQSGMCDPWTHFVHLVDLEIDRKESKTAYTEYPVVACFPTKKIINRFISTINGWQNYVLHYLLMIKFDLTVFPWGTIPYKLHNINAMGYKTTGNGIVFFIR